MSSTDDLLRNAERHATGFTGGQLASAPARRVAVVACMDARLDPYGLLGLSAGDAHVIRNGGGVVTDDVIRSLSISQRRLGTEEIVLIHHTDCGLLTFTDDEFKQQVEDDTGVRPEWDVGTFSDLDESVRESIARIEESPFVPNTGSVRGFVYDVADGSLREVDSA